jgi:hypothetical protein
VSDRLRVAIDLSGPHEPLGNWMALLADALAGEGHYDVVRFQTGRENFSRVDAELATRAFWRPWWQRSRGRRVDQLLPGVDVIHVAGVATPPTRDTPLVISVDDLRALRDDSRGRQRAAQLRRAVARGAQLVASSRAASVEVQRALDLAREHVVVVAPPVAWSTPVVGGENLVVNLTGRTDEFLRLAPALSALARRRGAHVEVLASHEAAARIGQRGLDVVLRPRREAADVLTHARTVFHLSDGARFPSFAVAALAGGVPTCATSTSVNRELLEGAAVLVDDADEERLVGAVEELWESEPRRAVLAAAGRDRAGDFSPEAAARSYGSLYGALDRRRARL